MPNINEVFGGNYLKASDLHDEEIVLTIAGVCEKEFENNGKKQKKLDVWFADDPRHLILNVTNARKIAQAHGPNTDAWIDKKIQLYVAEVEFQGDTVPAIRVRTGKKPAPAPRRGPPDFVDTSHTLDDTF